MARDSSSPRWFWGKNKCLLDSGSHEKSDRLGDKKRRAKSAKKRDRNAQDASEEKERKPFESEVTADREREGGGEGTAGENHWCNVKKPHPAAYSSQLSSKSGAEEIALSPLVFLPSFLAWCLFLPPCTSFLVSLLFTILYCYLCVFPFWGKGKASAAHWVPRELQKRPSQVRESSGERAKKKREEPSIGEGSWSAYLPHEGVEGVARVRGTGLKGWSLLSERRVAASVLGPSRGHQQPDSAI